MQLRRSRGSGHPAGHPRHRRTRHVALALVAAAASAACARGSAALPASGVSSLPPRIAVALGDVVTTAHGNRVKVAAYQATVRTAHHRVGRAVAAIDVRACAAPRATRPVTVNPAGFLLLFHDGVLRPSGVAAGRPLLRSTSVAPGHCAAGWLTYLRPSADLPIGVVLSGSTVVLWKLPVR